jgi:hypothetical protein
VSFTAPADDGGSAVTGYTVTATDTTTAGNGGQTVTGSSSPLTVTGLTNGDSYTFTVQAVNAAGLGPASAPSAAVTPQAPGQSAAVRFTGALTYRESGDATSGAIDVKTVKSITTMTGSVTITGVDGGSATITLNASEIPGLGLGVITVRDPGAHLDASALVVGLTVSASGEVTGTAIELSGQGSYTLSFSVGSSASDADSAR